MADTLILLPPLRLNNSIAKFEQKSRENSEMGNKEDKPVKEFNRRWTELLIFAYLLGETKDIIASRSLSNQIARYLEDIYNGELNR